MASRAITVDPLDQGDPADKRAWFRTRTICRVVKVKARGQQAMGRVHNISNGGVCLSTPIHMMRGDLIKLYFTDTLWIGGRIVWRGAESCGVQFDHPVNCRQLLADATSSCMQSAGEPLTLTVCSLVTVSTGETAVRTTLRSLSPLCLRLEARPSLPAGTSGTIQLPSGHQARGVVRSVVGEEATFLLCTPLNAAQIGPFVDIDVPAD